jgi:hypothetical protein
MVRDATGQALGYFFTTSQTGPRSQTGYRATRRGG